MALVVPLVVVVFAAMLLGLGAIVDDRRARLRRLAEVAEVELAPAPALLHSINEDRCIGCEACIDVCPTEVLDLVDHKVKVSRFSDCVQCEQCATSCPTTALVMYREGTTPRMLTVPELDDHFQTAVPGQYLVGEIAGKPLVKNAANLGRAVIEHIRKDLAGHARPAGVLDVAIVGSGPAGLSAGLTCLKYALSCVVLEKEHVISSTVARYPKGKHFMAEPVDAQNVSFLPVFDGTKEELVAAWQRVVTGAKLPIKLGEAVETVKRGDDGIFEIKTTVATYRARTVVLATGLRGKPRLLAVPGANLEKVQSLLDDPAEFAGEHVLVVGGGDSAVEGAMSLADVGATVTLSYRGDGFKRCKQGNQKRLAEMVAASKVELLLESNVKEFTAREVTIKLKDGSVRTLPNQRAFVLIGADTPVTWLEANSVRFVERPHLYALGSTEDVVRRVVPDALECARAPEEALATILNQPVHRSAGRRVLSVVESIREELHDVVTSVSGAFRLQDLEELRRQRTRTPAAGVHVAPRRAKTAPVVHGTIIPAARLTRGTRPATEPALKPAHRASTASPFGDFVEERTAVDGHLLRPSSARRDGTGAFARIGDTGAFTRIGDQTGAIARIPDAAVPLKISNATAPRRALGNELDSAFDAAIAPARPARSPIGRDTDVEAAFDRAFDHSDAPVTPRPRSPLAKGSSTTTPSLTTRMAAAAAAARPVPPPRPPAPPRAPAPAPFEDLETSLDGRQPRR